MNTTKRALPMLETIQIASPCTAKWDDMVGDARVRFCGDCQKNVYNLSAMVAEDAERLLQERGGNLCVRFFTRADGTVMTEDCPVGVKKKRRKKAALAIAGAGAMAFGALTSLTRTSMGEPLRRAHLDQPAMGGAMLAEPVVSVTASPPPAPVKGATTAQLPAVVGTVAPPPPPPPQNPAFMGALKADSQPPARPLMGKPAPRK